MKPAHLRATTLSILLFIASGLLAGCYTQFSGNQGDYYGYTGQVHKAPRPVHSDTIVERPAQTPPASQMAAKYDTVVKGDTVFIDEHPKAQLSAPTTDDGTTIINNYYDDSWSYPSYWDYYWHPHHHAVISIEIGQPWWGYHSWYSPWYAYYPDWYYPYYGAGYCGGWNYAGFYPPVYDCYAPFYSYYGPGYYYPYYNYNPYWGFHRFDDDGYRGYRGNTLRVPHTGRLGGESRSVMTSLPGQHSTIGVSTLGPNSASIAANGGRSMNPDVARAGAPANVSTESLTGDRNAPVHVVAPSVGGSITHEEVAVSQANQRTGGASSFPSHPVIVRRTAGQVISTTSTMRDMSGKQRVVVMRRSPQGNAVTASRSYGPAGRSYNYGGGGNSGVYSRSGSYGGASHSSYGGGSSSHSSASSGGNSGSGGGRSSGGERSTGGERSSSGGGHSREGGNAR